MGRGQRGGQCQCILQVTRQLQDVGVREFWWWFGVGVGAGRGMVLQARQEMGALPCPTNRHWLPSLSRLTCRPTGRCPSNPTVQPAAC